MNPPPPIPATYGSVTPRVAPAATAASTALPPERRVWIAGRGGSGATVAAAPPVPVATGVAAACGRADARWALPARSAATAAARIRAAANRVRTTWAFPGAPGDRNLVVSIDSNARSWDACTAGSGPVPQSDPQERRSQPPAPARRPPGVVGCPDRPRRGA